MPAQFCLTIRHETDERFTDRARADDANNILPIFFFPFAVNSKLFHDRLFASQHQQNPTDYAAAHNNQHRQKVSGVLICHGSSPQVWLPNRADEF